MIFNIICYIGYKYFSQISPRQPILLDRRGLSSYYVFFFHDHAAFEVYLDTLPLILPS